jgi:glutaredoxin 3
MAKFELYGTSTCPYTREMREWLEWKRAEFVEYDVDQDAAARERLTMLTPNQRAVPVLVQEGEVVEIGWQGRSCVIGEPC